MLPTLFIAALAIVSLASGQKICKHDEGAMQYTPDPAILTTLVCAPPLEVLLGDFNGDGRTDWFCRDPSGAAADKYVFTDRGGAIFAGLKDVTMTGWCLSTVGVISVGDFDGDGRDDLVCRHINGEKFFVRYSTGNGFKGPIAMHLSMVCPTVSHDFLVGDIDGNRVDDFVCSERSSGDVYLQYNGRSYGGRGGYYSGKSSKGYVKAFCVGTNKKLLMGDFDGDKKQDLACHDQAAESLLISYAALKGDRAYGHYSRFMSSKPITIPVGFCNTAGFDNTLTAADIDGDKRDDLVCITEVTVTTANELILFNDGNCVFADHGMTVSTVSYAPATTQFGDFNGDGRQDLAVLGAITFPLTIIYATCNE